MFSQFTACSMLTVSTNMGIQAIRELIKVGVNSSVFYRGD